MATPTPSPATDIPEEWQKKQKQDSDAFHVHSSQDHITVLATTEFVLNHTTNWPKEKRLMIYAETICLRDDINVKSGKLLLSCNSLVLAKPSITINVSGEKGQDCLPGQDNGALKDGKDGGTVVVYMETYSDSLMPKYDKNGKLESGLLIIAEGGDGSSAHDHQYALAHQIKMGGTGGAGSQGGI